MERLTEYSPAAMTSRRGYSSDAILSVLDGLMAMVAYYYHLVITILHFLNDL